MADGHATVLATRDMTTERWSGDVLVIDDSDLCREAMACLLEESGFTVVTLPTALGATKMIMRNSIDVVVTDVDMPSLSGTTLIQLLRKNARCARVKVVLISGLDAYKLSNLCTEFGADAAVEKSRMTEDLVLVVRRLMRSVRPKQPAQERSG
jgi:DNA-binding response OmpR family regulator